MDGYGHDANEAFAEFLNSVRGGDAAKIEGAWKAAEYWLFIVRTALPDLSDPRVQAAVGAPRWARHGPGEPPKPGLYLRYGRFPQGFGFLGAYWHCVGVCPPDTEGWGWLYGPMPPPPGYCDAVVAGRSGP
jgi:hypothetical protein